MNPEKLVKELIEDGYIEVFLCRQNMPTDEDEDLLREQLILDRSGTVIARKVLPDCTEWSMIYWTIRKPLWPLPGNVIDLDLSKASDAEKLISTFGTF
ncbi:hypothetical protein [Pantoea sp. 1B4]|uniref:hypothetical protein n=1 Tax=Pantoea sp. 1B4 TaxID=2804760 RepID=UPI001AA3E80A|nr:hypothetical protein [Pantoea sp. 1B4]MBN1090626.1 hypothetical protein [Pantoea sp. 1B4]